ncbi:MAG: hypothetical protein ACOCQ4_02595 [bacterium]
MNLLIMNYGELRVTLKARVSNAKGVKSAQIRNNIELLDHASLDSINDKLAELPKETQINKIDFNGNVIDISFTSGDKDSFSYIQ